MFNSVRNFLRTTALWIALTPLALTFFGSASNQVVLIANKDRFPVCVNAVKLQEKMISEQRSVTTLPDGVDMIDSVHCVMSDKTHLNYFADIFDFHDRILSIGDMLIELGDWSFNYCLLIWSVVMVQKIRNKEV